MVPLQKLVVPPVERGIGMLVIVLRVERGVIVASGQYVVVKVSVMVVPWLTNVEVPVDVTVVLVLVLELPLVVVVSLEVDEAEAELDGSEDGVQLGSVNVGEFPEPPSTIQFFAQAASPAVVDD
jgi:hypothetical protein